MTDAPERIWLTRSPDRKLEAIWIDHEPWEFDGVEYVRADLAPREAVEGELREWLSESIKTMELCREQRLKVATVLAKAGIIPDDDSCKITDEAFSRFIEHARAALSRASAPIRAESEGVTVGDGEQTVNEIKTCCSECYVEGFNDAIGQATDTLDKMWRGCIEYADNAHQSLHDAITDLRLKTGHHAARAQEPEGE